MGRRWRIRHKLLLGLGVVVALVALLLAGTLRGLLSYYSTMKSISSKLTELEAADVLKQAVSQIPTPNSWSDRPRVLDKVHESRTALERYEVKLKDTLDRGRDPDKGFQENLQTEALHKLLDELESEVNQPVRGKDLAMVGSDDIDAAYRKRVEGAIKPVVQTAADLHSVISAEMSRAVIESKRVYYVSMWIVLTTSIVGVLLMAGLLRFFYRWVFDPIGNLQAGAGRIAQGNFDHRIDVRSGDEMEDLAAAFNDMTERLHEMYTDLARQVNERSRQLLRSEQLASVGFLAAGVAHEINNPLASIAFCSEALEARLSSLVRGSWSVVRGEDSATTDDGQRTTEADLDVVTKYLRMIQQEAFRCKAITQKLLEFSRGGDKTREPVKLADLIQSVLDMVEHLQSCKGKRIDFEPAAGVVAWVNAQEVKSVVLNLVVNALDSMEEGGVLTIRLRQRAGMAELTFADTGCGMMPEVLENIFEPFFTRSRTGKGTGLGLTISHRIITQHGGEIEAASDGLGQGSTFTVRLPLQPVEEPAARSQESEVSGQEQGSKEAESGYRRQVRRAA